MGNLFKVLSIAIALLVISLSIAAAASSGTSAHIQGALAIHLVNRLIRNPSRYIYLYSIAGRPLVLSFNTLSSAMEMKLGHRIVPQYIHIYAFIGSKFVELPVRLYTSVVEFKPFRNSPTLKLYVYEPGKNARMVVKLPRELPLCKPVNLSLIPDSSLIQGLWLLKVELNPLRDPIASYLATQLENRVSKPLSKEIAKEFAQPITLCLYIAYEPPIPNIYMILSAVESPNYVASYDINGITLYETQVFGLSQALSLAHEPITSARIEELRSLLLQSGVAGAESDYSSQLEESSTPMYWFVDVSPSYRTWVGIDKVVAKQEISTPEEKVKAIPERLVAIVWVKREGESQSSPSVTTVTTPISSATTGAMQVQRASGVANLDESSRYSASSEALYTLLSRESDRYCELAVSLKITTMSGKVLDSLPTRYYLIDLSKLNYIVASFDLSYEKIEQLVVSSKEKVIAIVSVKNADCYDHINISIDRIVVLYAKQFSTANDNYISRNYVTISILGTSNLNGSITQLPGGDILTRISNGVLHLYISSRISNVTMNMVIPPVTGGSFVLEYKTVNLGLKIENEGAPTVKVRICTSIATCSNWVSLSAGESKDVSVEVPQPVLVYSLVSSNGIPLRIDIQKEGEGAAELLITPNTINLRTRIATSCMKGESYYGYSSIEASMFATQVPSFGAQEVCYLDVASLNSKNGRSAYIFEDYVKSRISGIINLGVVTTGYNTFGLLLISFNGYTSGLNVKEVEIRVANGECSNLWVHAIVPQIVRNVKEILSYIPSALSTVDMIAEFVGLGEASLIVKFIETPVELALEVATHATETKEYCQGEIAEVKGPLIGGIEGINTGFIVELNVAMGKVTLTRIPITMRYTISGSAGKLVDKVRYYLTIPTKGIPS